MEEFTINKDFAERYHEYRQREELDKLKSRHGDVSIADQQDASDTESSESEDSEAEMWTADDEKSFLRVYSALVRKDPKLYDQNKKWYKKRSSEEGDHEETEANEVNKKNGKKVLLKEYQREFLTKKGGVLGDVEEEEGRRIAKTDSDAFLKSAQSEGNDLDKLKAKFHQGFESDSDEEFIKPRQRDSGDESGKDDDEEVLRYLRGEVDDIVDEQLKNELGPLKEMWSKSNDESDKYLKEYLTNKLWKPKHSDRIPTYNEIVGKDEDEEDDEDDDDDSIEDAEEIDRLSEDEAFMKKANKFENKWNTQEGDEEFENQYSRTTSKYRFEEEDDLLKHYPRKIEDSLRQSKSETRAQREQRRKDRKKAEKEAKYQEIEELKKLKLQDIASRLEKIQRTCGAKQLKGLDPSVLDDDWDPNKHDALVKEVFDNEYYGMAEDEKPVFSSSDDDADVEDINWDRWKGPQSTATSKKKKQSEEKSQIASSSLNAVENNSEIEEEDEEFVRSRRRRRRGRGNLLRKALEKKKPTFDPKNYPGFEEYFDEVYQLDCEDILPGIEGDADIRCRYTYRDVEPNDFGLTTDEILAAKDKELNAWVSVKKMSSYRSKEEDRRDKQIFWSRKKQSKKERILQSLSQPEPDVAEENEKLTLDLEKNGTKESIQSSEQINEIAEELAEEMETEEPAEELNIKKSKNKKKRKIEGTKDSQQSAKRKNVAEESLADLEPPKKKKNVKQNTKPALKESRLEALALNPKSYKHLKVKHV